MLVEVDDGYAFDKEEDSCQVICPKGKYQTTEKITKDDEEIEINTCVLCDKNKYCDEDGLTAPKDCPAGYYCPNNVDITKIDESYHPDKYLLDDKNRIIVAKDGGLINSVICTKGNYCPPNSKAQTICPAGSKCPVDGMGDHILCPAGTISVLLDKKGEPIFTVN